MRLDTMIAVVGVYHNIPDCRAAWRSCCTFYSVSSRAASPAAVRPKARLGRPPEVTAPLHRSELQQQTEAPLL
jgi:hypothetical protein